MDAMTEIRPLRIRVLSSLDKQVVNGVSVIPSEKLVRKYTYCCLEGLNRTSKKSFTNWSRNLSLRPIWTSELI